MQQQYFVVIGKNQVSHIWKEDYNQLEPYITSAMVNIDYITLNSNYDNL